MYTTNLRKVGGSIMLIIPPAVLDILHMKIGKAVGLFVHKGRLVIEPEVKPQYTLNELISLCDASAEITDEDKDWLNNKPIGKEEI